LAQAVRPATATETMKSHKLALIVHCACVHTHGKSTLHPTHSMCSTETTANKHPDNKENNAM